MGCDPACVKIIIDTGGRLARAARNYAEAAELFAKAYAVANENGLISSDQKERLHALAELDCKRATKMLKWAEDLHHRAVDELAGGEYDGTYEIIGTESIQLKGTP